MSGLGLPHLAGREDIIRWADQTSARSDLPGLVRRLIQSTNDSVTRLRMPRGGAVDFGGYDGEVEAAVETPLVPAGSSVWEMGAGADPRDKANRDYRKRTRNPGGKNQAETTFVFVTPRHWDDGDDWAAGKRAEGKWRDVRVIDVDDLELAMESAPNVHFWFSELVGKPIDGAQTIEDWWTRFSVQSSPNLTPQMVVQGRDDAIASLLRALNDEVGHTHISGASVDDVIAFVAATMILAADEGQPDLLSRALLVHDAPTIRYLDATSSLFILVPNEEDLYRAAQNVTHHHVLYLRRDGNADLDLPPIDRGGFARELHRAGLDPEVAEKLAVSARRSIGSFQRAASGGRAAQRTWSSHLSTLEIRRAWFVGAWNADVSGDREILGRAAGCAYEELEAQLGPVVAEPDPLFVSVGSSWGVADLAQSWEHARTLFTGADLDALEAVVQEVLGSIDPALELDVDQRWAAAIYDKSRPHSNALRRGTAKTLALLSASTDGHVTGSNATTSQWAERVAGNLLHRANQEDSADLWLSLADVLPLLAEAAPDTFLRCIQEACTGDSPPVLAFFQDSDEASLVVGSSAHTELLWALEGLAWSPDLMGFATGILARLAAIDPGGRLSNRPIASLIGVFRGWLPGTAASVDAQTTAMRSICESYPDVGWQLCTGLFPSPGTLTTGQHKPSFRRWYSEDVTLTATEIAAIQLEAGELCLALLGEEPARFVDFADHYRDVPAEVRTRALDLLESAQFESAEQRSEVWAALAEVARRNEVFSDADWALPEDDRVELEEALSRLAPPDPVEANAWLFDYRPDLPGRRELPRDEYEAELAKARRVAIEAVYAAAGIAGIVEVASRSADSWSVGFALAESDAEVAPSDVIALLGESSPQIEQAARGFFRRATTGDRDELLKLAESLPGSPLEQARLLSLAEIEPMTWDSVAGLGSETATAYWAEIRTHGLGPEFPHMVEMATLLVEHGRPAAAFDLLQLYGRRDPAQFPAELAASVIEGIANDEDPDSLMSLGSYEFGEMVGLLEASDLDRDRLATIEWRFLSLMPHGDPTPALELAMGADPSFFVEILSLAYRPEKASDSTDDPRTEDEPEPTAQEIAQAQNAHSLLSRWRIVPGSDRMAGEVDEAALAEWVAEVRRLAGEIRRGDVADIQIGEILSHSAPTDDGTWPQASVAAVVESVASTELEQGLAIGIRNSRGVTTRSMTSGGDQERQLVTKYSEWAKAAAAKWPRTAAVLRSVASQYETEARYHDQQVERFHEGMDR